MLKNKFGMLKVLALALSVLMLVSLAACGNNGVAKEDMDSAIAAALAEQSKAEASKQAALESSLAAAQAAAESERKAVESSLAAAAAEASKAAAEASKAAASAEKKASEEASKAAAEASKAAASASKALEEATRTTTTKATTTTTAPIVADKDAIAAVQAEFAKLRHEYTYTNEGLYLADNYAELTLLFDKAAVELQNALTKEAAESILATLKVEAAAIENVQNRADAVQALIAALGDIESEMFTTQAEMITEAQKAYTALKVDYDTYFGYDVDEKKDGANTVKKATKLGVNVADLNKAKAKLVVLEDYIEASLWVDMLSLYQSSGNRAKFNVALASEAELATVRNAYYKYLVLAIVNGGDMAESDMPVDWDVAVNEDGVEIKADANATHPVTGKTLRYELDMDAPIAYFETSDLLEIYILPTLDADFEDYKTAALDTLKKTLNGDTYDAIAAQIGTLKDQSILVDKDEIVYHFEGMYYDFETELNAISFIDDYKGNVTLADAVADLYTRVMIAYVDGVNAIIEQSKSVAIDIYDEFVYAADVDEAKEDYGEKEDAATLAALLAEIEADLAAYTANVEATPAYDFDAVNAAELRDLYSDKTNTIEELTEYLVDTSIPKDGIVDAIDSAFTNYVNTVIVDAINNNFDVVAGGSSSTVQSGELLKLVRALVADLKELRAKLDPTESTGADHLYNSSTRGSVVAYLDGEKYIGEKYYANIPKFEAMMADIDKAIADLQAISVDNYEDKDVAVKTDDNTKDAAGNYKLYGKTFGSDYKNKALYYVDAAAKEYAEKNYPDADEREIFLLETALNANIDGDEDIADGISAKQIKNGTATSTFLTVNKTDYPLNYVYTAAEQAQKAAYDIYNAAFSDVHNKVLGYTGLVSTYQKKVNNSYGAVKAIRTNVGGNADLLAEVDEFIALYTNRMATEAAKATNSITHQVWNEDEQVYETKFGGWVASVNINHWIGMDHVTCNTSELANTNNYVLKGCDAQLQGYVDDFYDAFFTDDNKTESNIVVLWEYKTNAVKYITEALKGYKNTYTTKIGANNITETVWVKPANANAYEYDKDLTAPSLNGAAYEAAIDALIDTYTNNIMGVKLQSRLEIRNYLAKDMNGGSNDNRLLAKVGDWAWTIDSARASVNAYVVDLLGYDAVDTKYTVGVKDLYSSTTLGDDKFVDSRVYSKYKAEYKNLYGAIKLPMA